MKKLLALSFAVIITLFVISRNSPFSSGNEAASPPDATVASASTVDFETVTDSIRNGESLSDVFTRLGLDMEQLYAIVTASKGTYNLSKVVPGREISFEVDDENKVHSLTYAIDGDHILKLSRTEDGFKAEKESIPYETTLVHISGTVDDNLVSAMDDLLLALALSDIFAWDIDFTTDIRRGDTFKIVVEELRIDGKFKKYGSILSAEFTNNGVTHHAYRFEQKGSVDYFDSKGKSLRRSLLKAPLSYRRISSGFTRRRYHPVLKTYRPHLGVDYAAARGTPVSTVGDGTVQHAAYKGANGNLVIIRHPNGYVTYYGHLASIKKGVRAGVRVRQGQVIGYVGSTGRATGPHLDYRIKKNGSFVNPLTLKLPPGKSVESSLLADFRKFRDMMDLRLTSIELPTTVHASNTRKQG